MGAEHVDEQNEKARAAWNTNAVFWDQRMAAASSSSAKRRGARVEVAPPFNRDAKVLEAQHRSAAQLGLFIRRPVPFTAQPLLKPLDDPCGDE